MSTSRKCNPVFFISLLLLANHVVRSTQTEYGKGFLNHTGCLYAHLGGGDFELISTDGDVIQKKLDINSLSYDTAKTQCTGKDEPGKVVFSFKIADTSKVKMVTVSMRVVASLSEGYWEVSQANLTITRADVDRKRTFPLRIMDIYASLAHSYSCDELVLQTFRKKTADNETKRIEPRARIVLDKFQLQPFSELQKVVFAPSFDCATFMSVSGIMGLMLILFTTAVVITGVIFLLKIETNDFKYSKEGQLFTQSQMESNKQK